MLENKEMFIAEYFPHIQYFNLKFCYFISFLMNKMSCIFLIAK